MRISLNSLLTLMTFVAWLLALRQIPRGYAGSFVAGSFAFVMVMMLIVAISSSVNKDGSLEYEKNSLHAVFATTFKLTALLLLVFVIGTLFVLPITLLAWEFLHGTI